MEIFIKRVYQYMVIFLNFYTTSNHLHPLQVGNCDSNSRLVVEGDDNGKFRTERVKRPLVPKSDVSPYIAVIDFRRQILTSKFDPRTEKVKIFLRAVDPQHMYSNKVQGANWDIYDDLKLKKILWSPCFIQKYFSVVRGEHYFTTTIFMHRVQLTYLIILSYVTNTII